ncbi:chromatin remodelling complex Rsc7/Swp82 subunit-domain-containing protein [Phlyctochytrium arcticum]|nr:chromatin remodelling complex Rsc7/Swp82 subunit-domain-containing protein [Phlyctochytrium arcticum]
MSEVAAAASSQRGDLGEISSESDNEVSFPQPAEEPSTEAEGKLTDHNGRPRSSTPAGRKRKSGNMHSDDEQPKTPPKRGRPRKHSQPTSESPGRQSARKSGKAAEQKIRDAYLKKDDDILEDSDEHDDEYPGSRSERARSSSTPRFNNRQHRKGSTDRLEPTDELKDDVENHDELQAKEEDSPMQTPHPRRRGRPPGSGAGARRKLAAAAQEDTGAGDGPGVRLIEEEDVETEWDPKGEEKITKDGDLTGGREFRIRTFTLPRHPTRKYMLTVDISKTLQYRDTYIFFLKNPHITRIQGTEEDKSKLENIGILPGQLRRRPVSLATARSIFRAFGHKAIKRGRVVRDDYWVGDQEEPPEEPEEPEYEKQLPYNGEMKVLGPRDSVLRRQTSRVGPEKDIHNPYLIGPRHEIPATLRGDDYLYRRAASAAEFNRRLLAQRANSFLDYHTNIEQVPSLTQPTHVGVQIAKGSLKWPLTVEPEVVVDQSPSDSNNWLPVPTPKVEEEYPLAIMPGQYQGMLSINRRRFGQPDVPLDETGFREVRQLYAPSLSQNSMHTPIKDYSQAPLQMPPSRFKHLEHFCGEITRSGQGCKRPVYNAGEKCLYHVKPAEKPSMDPNACIHCHSIPPKHPTKQVLPNTMLICASCKTKHHPSCMDFDDPVLITKVQTYEWRCSECKTCVVCNQAGDDDKLLFCDTCDRGYHTYCLTPPLDAAPEGDWLCDQCAVCISCDRRPKTQQITPPRTPTKSSPTTPLAKTHQRGDVTWKHAIVPAAKHESKVSYGTYVCTYCEDCYHEFERDKFCPLCMHVYTEDEDSPMACCDSCDRWIHVGCDPSLTEERYEELGEDVEAKYTCVLCDPSSLRVLLQQREGRWSKVVEYKNKVLVAPPLVKRAIGGGQEASLEADGTRPALDSENEDDAGGTDDDDDADYK